MSKMSLKWRIILPITAVLVIGITLLVALVIKQFSDTTVAQINHVLEAEAFRHANAIMADIDGSFGGISALAAVLGNAAGTEKANRADYLEIMQQINESNRGFFGIWTVFEPNAFDGDDAQYVNAGPENDATGRFIPYIFNLDGKTNIEALAGYETPGTGDYYLIARNSGHAAVTPPYYYEAGGSSFYVASAAMPIRKNGKIIGVAGRICRSTASARIWTR